MQNNGQAKRWPRAVTRMATGLGLTLAGSAAYAANVAVIDSGLDTEQTELVSRIWLNPIDSTVNGVDEDSNGYTDDVHGWDFADNTYQLIDHSFANLYSPDVVKYFQVQTRSLNGQAAADDVAWAKSKLADPNFIANLETYGNYAHGTHVSGIIARQGEGVTVMGIKLIPTKSPVAAPTPAPADGKVTSIDPIRRAIFEGLLSTYANQAGKLFGTIGKYVDGEKMDVANGSFGAGLAQARGVVGPLLQKLLGDNPAPSLIDDFAVKFLQDMVKAQKSLIDSAPNTLYVFAAGNDKSDNDVVPTAPATIASPRVIAVAAAYADGRLAPFSNFGATTVDLAAPGVGIESTVPDNHHLLLSGTSQAAPHVAGVAAAVKTINPELSAEDVKKVILGTVDVVPQLKGKVKTSGFLNGPRAQEAAKLSKTESLEDAIADALADVGNAVAPAHESLEPETTPNVDLWFDVQPHLLTVK